MHCSCGDGNRWSSCSSSVDRPLALLLILPLVVIIIMLSVQSSAALGRAKDTALWSATFTLVLCATRAMQFGSTVTSPIASFDVHFRKSSTAAGYKKQREIKETFLNNWILNDYKRDEWDITRHEKWGIRAHTCVCRRKWKHLLSLFKAWRQRSINLDRER